MGEIILGNPALANQATLLIHLLGRFSLSFAGQVVANFHPRLQALLALVLLSSGGSISRQLAAARLWPDTNESQARTNLRHLLHTLRASLPNAHQYLLVTAEILAWNQSAPYNLDVAEFEWAARQPQSLDALQRAAALYGGDLLPDCYDEWIIPERDRLRDVFQSALHRQVDLLLKSGDLVGAIQAANRLLQADPLNEATYQCLMQLYAGRGDRAGVVRIYETCCQVLQNELGIEPGAETQAAFRDCTALKHLADPATQPEQAQPWVKGRLPRALGRMIGRAQEKHLLLERIYKNHLTVLTGFGGVGKTRMALAAAAEMEQDFPEGVWWIDLSPVSDPDQAVQAAAVALNITGQPDQSMLENLVDHLGTRRRLLVLDNCEHILEGAAQLIQAILNACPETYILATSRVSLRVPGEAVFPVRPLGLPAEDRIEDSKAGLSESEALFVERASAVNPLFKLGPNNFKAVRQICRRLDGIPLAIELAAACVRMTSAHQIAERLEDAFRLLGRGNPAALPRHQNLRATLDWSYGLLAEGERCLLNRLSVFAGSFSLPAAEVVASGRRIEPARVLELLAGLIDHSLVGVEEAGSEVRYRLHEVMRQYAAEKLDAAGEKAMLQVRHLDFYCELAEQAEPQLRGKDQLDWIELLDSEMDNFHAAIQAGFDQRQVEGVQKAARIVAALWIFWFIKGRFVEALNWSDRAVKAGMECGVASGVLGRVCYTAASFSLFQGLMERGRLLTEDSLKFCRQAGDAVGTAISLHHMGMLAVNNSAEQQAEEFFREGLELARKLADPWLESVLLIDLGDLDIVRRDFQSAYHIYQQCLEVNRRSENLFGIVYALTNLGDVAFELKEYSRAVQFSEEGLRCARQMGEPRCVAFNLNLQARLKFIEGLNDAAGQLWKESLAILWEVRDRESILAILELIARNACEQGKEAWAVRLLSACQALRSRFNLKAYPAEALCSQELAARLHEKLGDPDFDILSNQGQGMNIEQAVLAALDGLK